MFDFKKRHMKEEKDITLMENKVDKMYNILKSVPATV